MKKIFLFILIKSLFAVSISSEEAIEIAKNVIYERSDLDRSQLVIDEIISI